MKTQTTTNETSQGDGMMNHAIVEREQVKVGDFVGFKDDIEQEGRITKISRDWQGTVLTIRVYEGDEGDRVYIKPASRCWLV